MKKAPVIHPFLFALFPILFLYARNIGQLPLNVIFLPIAVTICFTFLFWTLLSFLFKDKKKAGLLVSFFLLIFFSYGHFRSSTKDLAKTLLCMSGSIFFLGTYFTIKINRDLRNFTKLLNVITTVLIFISLINIGAYKLKILVTWMSNRGVEKVEKTETDSINIEKTTMLPNIYFIILDAYAGEDILKEIYGHDNTEFCEDLTQRGFCIANESSSNYCQTGLTLASCLNLKYLDIFAKRVGVESKDHGLLREIIKNSYVFDFLRQNGYRVVAFSSGTMDSEITTADVYLTYGFTFNQFQNLLINTTPLMDIIDIIRNHSQFEQHRERLLYILDHLSETCSMKTPICVFAHIVAPHPPFLFGREGEKIYPEMPFTDHDGNWLIRKDRLTREEYIKGYREQLIFISNRIKASIDDILSKSDSPPIIILMGDHGPRSMLNWEDPSRTYFKECMSILNAYYLPNGGDKQLYDGITPVNTFRVIFNHYFNADYTLLKDENFFSTASRPYKFINVTDEMKEN